MGTEDHIAKIYIPPRTIAEQLEDTGNEVISLLVWVIPIVLIISVFTSVMAVIKFKK
jgi:hypothetical protein